MTDDAQVQFSIVPKLEPMIDAPQRFLVAYGGRASGKSWSVARILLYRALTERHLILCAREFQNSIADSVHRLLTEQIEQLGVSDVFEIGQTSIVCTLTGSAFIFSGLSINPDRIKSMEGLTIVWCEEAQRLSTRSLEILIPTVRRAGSQLYFTFNPSEPTDPVYEQFITHPRPDALVLKCDFTDNPYCTDEVRAEAAYCASVDDDTYRHVWLGACRVVSDAQVLKGKYAVEEFDDELHKKAERLYYGMDFGFGPDPTAVVRAFVYGDTLYIDHEAYQIRADMDRIEEVVLRVPGADRWPVYCDASQPGTIALLSKRGITARAAEKWPGSIEDGIAALRSFRRIIVHPRCRHVADEVRLYSRKIDKVTGEPLPALVDANNHCIDALRYALGGGGLITKTGSHLRLYQNIGTGAANTAPAATVEEAGPNHFPLREAAAPKSTPADRIIAEAERQGIGLGVDATGRLAVKSDLALPFALATALANHGTVVAATLTARALKLDGAEEVI